MKNLIILTALALLASSCVTQRACNRKFPPSESVRTVTVTNTVYRDTTVFVRIPADTVYQETVVYVDRETGLTNSARSVLFTQYAQSWAQVVNGRLRHELVQNESEIAAVIDKAIRESSTHTEIVKVEIKEVARPLRWWQAGLQLWGIVMLVVGGYILFRAFRP